jgi:cell wall-associated NlpC family hydrolase
MRRPQLSPTASPKKSASLNDLFLKVIYSLSFGVILFQSPNLMAADRDISTDKQQVSSARNASIQQPAENVKNLFTDIKQYMGIGYRFGGQTPSGFDCSGFVRYMFGKAFNMQLPRSSREMSSIGDKVGRNELQPGDLVFFHTRKNRINHVGIFVGNDTFVHSSTSRGITKDKLNESYFIKRFAGGVRVLNLPQDVQLQDFEQILREGLSDTEPS